MVDRAPTEDEDAAGVDLDAPPARAPAQRGEQARSARSARSARRTPHGQQGQQDRAGHRGRRGRRWALAVLAGAAAVAALVAVQHARGGAPPGTGLVAVGGGLVETTAPTSADNNTRAVLRVDLRNDGETPVVLIALRPAGDAGSLMRDDLRSSGAESMGVDTGLTLRPGRRVPVVMAGAVRCPGPGGPPVGGSDLLARVRDGDGTQREVVVPGPTTRSWATALGRACALGPAR